MFSPNPKSEILNAVPKRERFIRFDDLLMKSDGSLNTA